MIRNLSRAILSVLLLALLACPLTADENKHTRNNSTEGAESYRLAAGDRVRIEVFGEDDLKRDLTLSDQGKISYPFLGELDVDNYTARELEQIITNGLSGAYLVNPEVNVSVLQYRPFFINGEVKQSGSYPYQPGLTLRKAIALAGGLTEHAAPNKISIIREKDELKQSQLIDYDASVLPGDIITVSEYKRVFVNGQVKNPGSYPYQVGLTLRKVIALAGGYTERAVRDSGYVISENSESQESKEIELEDIVSPGDIITIKQSFF